MWQPTDGRAILRDARHRLGSVRAAPFLSLALVAATAVGLVFQAWRRSATATPSVLGPGVSGSTASTSLESEQCCRVGGETRASAATAIRALREWTAGRSGALAGLDLWLPGGEYRNAERVQGAGG